MVVDVKVLIGIVDDDDPGTCQNLIWQKFFSRVGERIQYIFLAKDTAKDVLSAATTTTAAAVVLLLLLLLLLLLHTTYYLLHTTYYLLTTNY